MIKISFNLLNCFYIKPVEVLKPPLKGCSFISSITVVPENIHYQPFPPSQKVIGNSEGEEGVRV